MTSTRMVASIYAPPRYGDAAARPEDILIPDWHTNPLFYGSYSNWPIGVDNTVVHNLDAPIGRLYMAGEACSHKYNGYLHGALERCARHIALKWLIR